MKNCFFTLLGLLFSIYAYSQIGPITGGSTVCVGSTLALTDTTPGGTWSTLPPTIATINFSTGVLTGWADGGVTVTYTVGGGYVTKTVTVSSVPVHNMTGGGATCGGSAFHVGLDASDIGYNYQLMSSPTGFGYFNVGSLRAGTGSALDFGSFTMAGYYVARATNPATGCSRLMTASAVVTNYPIPTAYNVIGTGAYCAGGPGAEVLLVGSEPGIDYQAYRGATAVGSPQGGTGLGLSLGHFTAPGVYTVVGTNTTTGCSTNMNGSVSVSIITPPTQYSVTGGGSYCAGGPGVLVELSGSDPGVHYQMILNGVASGSPAAGSGSALSFGIQTTPGTYSVRAVDGTTGCTANMIGSASVAIDTGTCSGTPAPGIAVATATEICTGTGSNIAWSGPGACGLAFQWQRSSDMATWADISGETSATYLSTPTTSAYYRAVLTCPLSGMSTNSAPAYVATRTAIGAHGPVRLSDTDCSVSRFYLSACGLSSSFNVTTWFGDGTSASNVLTATGICHADIYHTYAQSGTYSVKQVLYEGVTPIDSVSFTCEYSRCSVFPFRIYYDGNANCVKDGDEAALLTAIRIAVDSNGVPTDTISATSGFYYTAFAPVGTIYGFRALPVNGLGLTCPSGGTIYDTILPSVSSYQAKYFGLNCSSGGTYDLAVQAAVRCGRHSYTGDIYLYNKSCMPQPVTATMYLSPKYHFLGSVPPPSAITSTSVTWNFPAISSATYPLPHIDFWMEVPGPWGTGWHTPGDTVHRYISISPTAADGDTSNNVIVKVDTVSSSYDPNEMEVSPSGYVLPCTKLQYTARFENTGNDTAQNIAVMDTLSDNLDPKSLEIVMASSQMNIAMIKSGGHTIVKFDFPNIKLPDSSHHGLCDGVVVFSIKARPGLPDGATINNRAGIFFDDNPAVLTNAVTNIIGVSAINGQPALCIGAQDTLWNNTPGGVWSASNAHASVAVINGSLIATGVTPGTDTIRYTLSNGCTSRSVTRVITINALPTPVAGPSALCMGAAVTLSDPTPGGSWSSANTSVATINVATGLVTPVAGGVDTFLYTLASGCKAVKALTINALPVPYTVAGGGAFCAGDAGVHITLGGSASDATYQLRLGGASVGAPVSGTGSALDMGLVSAAGTYTVVANAVTGCSANMVSAAVVNINPLPVAFTVTGGGAYCAGDTGTHIRLSGSTAGISYQLFNSSAIGAPVTGTGTALDMGLQSAPGTYTVMAANPATSCRKAMTGSVPVLVNPLPVAFAVTGGGSYCAGSTGRHVYLGTSAVGVRYQLYHGSSPDGPSLPGTGLSLDFGLHTGAGTYTVIGVSSSTSCHALMSDSASISVNALPTAFAVSGSGVFCSFDSGRHIFISASAAGVSYQLYNGITVVGAPVAGTGTTLDFGLHASTGTYTVRATDTATACLNTMAGSAILTAVPAVTPSVAIDAPGGSTICTGAAALFNATVVNGGAAPAYQWTVNGSPAGAGSSYSYTPHNSDLVGLSLTSNAVCAHPAITTASLVMNVLPLNIPVVSVTAYPGLTVRPADAVTFTAAIAGCSSTPGFQWFINATPVPGATNALFTTAILYDNDSISCQVSCAALCGHDGSGSVRLHVSSSAVSEPGHSPGQVDIYPNPNTGSFTLQTPATGSLTLFTLTGQQLHEYSIVKAKTELNLPAGLAPGMYIAKFLSDDRAVNKEVRVIYQP